MAKTKRRVRPIDHPALGPVLVLDRYVPFFFTEISNKLSRGASRLYLKHFGVGVIEWRVASMLAIEPNITANRICSVIGLDKAAVSRSLKRMERRGYVRSASDAKDTRRRKVTLTKSGRELHDRIFRVALERERRLLADLDPREIELLLDLLRRMERQIPAVNDYDPGDG